MTSSTPKLALFSFLGADRGTTIVEDLSGGEKMKTNEIKKELVLKKKNEIRLKKKRENGGTFRRCVVVFFFFFTLTMGLFVKNVGSFYGTIEMKKSMGSLFGARSLKERGG